MNNIKSRRRAFLGAALAAVAIGAVSVAPAAAQDAYFQGKTIRIVVGFQPGGGYDLYGRLVAQFLGRHIPGNPAIVVDNRPGASSKVAANYVYAAAPRDGTVIGTFLNNIALEGVMREDSRFDPAKFTWIGRAADATAYGVAWETSPVKSIEAAKTQRVVMGSAGATDHAAMIGWALNRLIGTKFEIITGYAGLAPAGLALERGEVHMLGSASLDFLKVQKAEWLREKKVTMMFSNDVRRNPDYPDVPTIAELVPAGEARQVMEALASAASLGRAFAAPPEIPAQAKAVLRKAFADMIADPELLADAKRRNMDINPASGEDLERMVAEIAALPKSIIAKIVEVTSPPAGSAPAR